MYLGIDIGTGKSAAVIIDKRKRVLASVSKPYSANVRIKTRQGRSEQDPVHLLNSAFSAVKMLPCELRGKIRAVGVTGQMHGVIVLDKGGSPLTPLINWQDQRCLEDKTFLETLNRKTGYQLRTGFGCATLAWLKKNGKLSKAVFRSSTIHDFAVMKLCGLNVPVIDPTNAASWGLFDLKNLCWDKKNISKAGIPYHILPELVSSGGIAGRTDMKTSKMLGIPANIPVAAALGDNQASLISTLNNPDEELALTLGTGGQLSAVLPPKTKIAWSNKSDTFEYRPFPGGSYAAVAASLCGGSAWNWLADVIISIMKDAGVNPGSKNEIFSKMNQLGFKAKCEIVINPNFLGERHNPDLRGSISGIDMNNFTLGSLSRGLARGIISNLRGMLPESVLKGRKRIMASGNALRKNPLLCKTAEEIFGLPLLICESKEEAAVGAAILAMKM